MNDVLRQVVLAGGDEDLGAAYLVGAVAVRLRLGLDLTQVGAAVGFGQAHGARPAAVGQLRQVGVLLLVAAVQVKRIVGAVAQARVHAEAEVGRADQLVENELQGVGQPPSQKA